MNFNHYHNWLSVVCYQANWITQSRRINESIGLTALSNNKMNMRGKNDVKLQPIRTWVKNFGWNCIKIVLPLNDGYNLFSNARMHQVYNWKMYWILCMVDIKVFVHASDSSSNSVLEKCAPTVFARAFFCSKILLRFMCTLLNWAFAYAFVCHVFLCPKYREKDIGLSVSPFCTQFNRIAADLWRCYTCVYTKFEFESPTLRLNHHFFLSLFLYRDVFTYADKQWSTVNANDEPTMNKIGFIFVEVEDRKEKLFINRHRSNRVAVTA